MKVWENKAPSKYQGKFWSFNIPDPNEYHYGGDHRALSEVPSGHRRGSSEPRISDTLRIAGERGYIPMSLELNTVYVASH